MANRTDISACCLGLACLNDACCHGRAWLCDSLRCAVLATQFQTNLPKQSEHNHDTAILEPGESSGSDEVSASKVGGMFWFGIPW